MVWFLWLLTSVAFAIACYRISQKIFPTKEEWVHLAGGAIGFFLGIFGLAGYLIAYLVKTDEPIQ